MSLTGEHGRMRALAVSALVVALALSGCAAGEPGAGNGAGTGGEDGDPAAARASLPEGVGIQLFQWSWDSVGAECPALAEAGIEWVLVSPAQEHIVGEEWWTAYQPVSHRVESRLGTREQFAAMTAACSDVGVDIVADAVINHMSGQDAPGTGWAGSAFEHYEYPGLFADADFHHCGLTPNDDIADYRDAEQVQSCELVNLADLDTGSESVRATITAYLEDLLSLGVAGFRIDAAKHMPAEDLEAILVSLPEGTVVVHEVIPGGGEPIQPADYLGTGALFEFTVARGLKDQFAAPLLDAERLVDGTVVLPSGSAVPFVANHDTERNGETLSYRDGIDYELAAVLLLGLDYGAPMLYSGYAFSGNDQGPPQDPLGLVDPVACVEEDTVSTGYSDGDWVCPQRWSAVRGILAWRGAVMDAPAAELLRRGGAYALARGDAGVLVVNAGGTALEAGGPDGEGGSGIATPLPEGRYCDLLSAGAAASNPAGTALVTDGRSCRGLEIAIDQGGVLASDIPPGTAVALLKDARITP